MNVGNMSFGSMNVGKRTLEHGNLSIDISQTYQHVVITWRGISDARDPASFLTALFDDLIREIQGRSVEVNFRPLRFMNSSTLSLIMVFIKALNANATPTRLMFDLNVDWQRINHQCMKIISRSLKSLQVEGHS